MECLHCGKKISALRKLQDEEFCSAAHRKAYKKKQEDLAVDFLRQTRPRRARQPVPPPVEPQPLPVLAESRPEHVAPSRVNDAPRHSAQPPAIPRQAILPTQAGLRVPSPRASGFAAVACKPRGASHQAILAQIAAVAFAGQRPALRIWTAQPLWIEPPKQTPARRQTAEFARLQHGWACAQPPRNFAPCALRFSSAPVLLEREIWPRVVTLRLACASQEDVAVSMRSISARESRANAWQSRSRPPDMPAVPVFPRRPRVMWGAPVAARKPKVMAGAVLAAPDVRRTWRGFCEILHKPSPSPGLHAPGLSACPPAASRVPRVSRDITNPPGSAARQFLTPSAGPPLIGSWRLEFATPALHSASRVRTSSPPWRPIPSPAGHTGLALFWKNKAFLGRHARVIPLRPNFEEPLLEPLGSPGQPDPPVAAWRRLGALWSAAPRWSRQLAAVLALSLLARSGFHHLKSSGSLQRFNDSVIARIRQRAAIDLRDDFRAGLSQWTGPPGWANSWTYDATGFARPGHLALLAGSAPLSDYHLEFLAEIDRKAVAWVFRAADTRNYYACKLLESKRGTGAVFFIVRYAVVGGHERLRIQLPLPVTATARSMVRVRQEIRGDQFTTYLDGRVIDTWSDASLASGGFGFFADPGETAYIRWVDVAYQDDTLGRICAYLVPAKHD